jgi:hypothetical protein
MSENTTSPNSSLPLPEPSDSAVPTRRRFLEQVGLGTAALAGAGALAPGLLGAATSSAQLSSGGSTGGSGTGACLIGPLSPQLRRRRAQELRIQAAKANFLAPLHPHECNGDETLYADKRNSFSKGLPHDPSTGLVDPAAYDTLVHALSTGDPADFEAVALTSPGSPDQRKLVNPQAGLAFDMVGADPQRLGINPAPKFASLAGGAEMIENYWMAILRDVAFSEYATHPLALQACAELTPFAAAIKAPTDQFGNVTPQALFRDKAPGTDVGHYLSQAWFHPLPYGAQFIEPTTQALPSGLDFMKDETNWLRVQNGLVPLESTGTLPVLRWMNDGRCLSQWVHIDVLFQAYFQMCLMLASKNAPPNPSNPYAASLTQDAFGTWGGPWAKTFMAYASSTALKTVWHTKWFVHRRARPEAYAGRVHYLMQHGVPFDVPTEVLNSVAVNHLLSNNGTALLPMAFPEGSPIHPSYGAGHATVAGCGATMLKFVFDGNAPWPGQALVPNAAGTALENYVGDPLTINGEINKVASNVATGRNIAGVHWRSDAYESLRLGQAVAVAVLRDHMATYNENVGQVAIQGFDGETILI